MKKKKNKQKEENCFVDLFKDISIGVVIEIVFSVIWNTLLFIPRMLIRFFTSI